MGPGSILGLVRETPLFEHRILVPPQVEGKVEFIQREGEYRIDETIACLRTPGGASGMAGGACIGVQRAWQADA